MRVTAKIVAHLADESRLKAIATVCLNNEFLITGVRVLESEKGPCVFMPSRKTNVGEYRDIAFPLRRSCTVKSKKLYSRLITAR